MTRVQDAFTRSTEWHVRDVLEKTLCRRVRRSFFFSVDGFLHLKKEHVRQSRKKNRRRARARKTRVFWVAKHSLIRGRAVQNLVDRAIVSWNATTSGTPGCGTAIRHTPSSNYLPTTVSERTGPSPSRPTARAHSRLGSHCNISLLSVFQLPFPPPPRRWTTPI
jgi:hypothetical protein